MRRILVSLSLILIVFSGIYFFFKKNYFTQIDSLKSGYILTTVVPGPLQKSGSVKYTFVRQKPRAWISLHNIRKEASQAILISEDWAFYDHYGVDLSQIKEAIMDSLRQGKKLRGASTISQQVVKNLFFHSDRSFLRKLNELFITLYMERVLSKRTILEVYLNIIEFGEDLYGLKNGSRFYFSKPPHDLNALEGAFLAMLLPNPKRYSQSFREKKLTPYARKIVVRVLGKMKRARFINEEKYQKLLQRKLFP